MKASNKRNETQIIEREVWPVLALQLKKTFWKSSFSLCHGGNEASSFIIPVYEQPVSRFRPAWRGAVRADTLSSPSPALPQEKVQSCRSPLCRHTATLANSYIITFFKAFFFFCMSTDFAAHKPCSRWPTQQIRGPAVVLPTTGIANAVAHQVVMGILSSTEHQSDSCEHAKILSASKSKIKDGTCWQNGKTLFGLFAISLRVLLLLVEKRSIPKTYEASIIK